MDNTFVGIDLGASQTRFISDDAKIYEMGNNIKEINPDEKLRSRPWAAETWEDEVLGSLDIEIDRIEGPTTHLKKKARYLVGTLANRMGASSTPNSLQNKAEQNINYTNAILAAALSKLFSNSDGDIKLYIALPPIELTARATSEAQLTEELIGSYVVKFNANINRVVTFRIVSVTCVEESFLTLASFFFKPEGGFRPEAKPYVRGNVLGIDIGASTTDLGVMQDCHILEKSGETYKLGGNLVLSIIADGIRASYGYDPEKEELQAAVETGMLEQGETQINIARLVEEAKKEFALRLVEKMQDYFTKIAITPNKFKAVVVGGGGSMGSFTVDENGNPFETTHPMSEYIWQEFKKVSGNVPVIQVSADPRHANINGLYIKAIVEKITAQRAEAALAPQLQKTQSTNLSDKTLRQNF